MTLIFLQRLVIRFKFDSYDAAAYFILPLGASLFHKKSGKNLTFNFSALTGFAFYFNEHWGIFAEAGYNMTVYPIGPVHCAEGSLGATYAF